MIRGKSHRPPRRAAFIPGDGIGPEVAWSARRCVEATGARISWVDCAVGEDPLRVSGAVLPKPAARSIVGAGLALQGPLDGSGPSFDRNPNTALSDLLEVFAVVRHCRSMPAATDSAPPFDVLTIGEFSGVVDAGPGSPHWAGLSRHLATGTSAATIRGIDAAGTREFFEYAFRCAAEHGRRKVTLVHRANAHKKADGAWLRIGTEVARRFPGIACEDQLADHVAMQLVRSPDRFDVLLITPLYAEVVADVAVGLAGGVEFVPEILAGRRGTIFTTVHGTAPRFVGVGRANPCAMILSGAELLRTAGEGRAAIALENAVESALEAVSRGGKPGLEGFAEAVVERVRRGPGARSRA